MRGRLVVLEGLDNAGKSTVLKALGETLSELGWSGEIVLTAEFTSPIGSVLKSCLPALSPLTKVYWFAADRAWITEQVSNPARERGALVVWDRYVDSALAYRKADIEAGSVSFDMALVRQVNAGFETADLTLLLDITVDEAVARGSGPPREILQVARGAYEELARFNNYVRIDASQSPTQVLRDCAEAICTNLKEGN